MAYKCRAYPAPEQASVLNRTFGCVRVGWNRTLAWRHARYHDQQATTNLTQANAYLAVMTATGDLAWLNQVSSVPLQQAGIDLGIKDFAVTSGGDKIPSPRTLARREQNLARYQRRMARCQRGSANRAKAKAKVARAHRKVRASRTDFLHRTSAALARGHDVIVLEDLAVTNMVRNRVAGQGHQRLRVGHLPPDDRVQGGRAGRTDRDRLLVPQLQDLPGVRASARRTRP